MTPSFTRLAARTAVFAVLLVVMGRPAAAQVTVPGNYGTIQAAINAVMNGSLPDGTVINVQPGTYPEALMVVNSARSFTVRGTGGAGATFVDAAGRGAAAVNVYRSSGAIVFTGLTFRNGTPPTAAGGGFVIQESSPSFIGCVFESNTASSGGGGALITSNAVFTDCTIRNNSAARSGGGVLIVVGSRPVFTRCDIVSNRSGTGPPGVGNMGVGGGVDARDSSPTFRGSRVSGNTSKFAAGGIYHGGDFASPYGLATLRVEDSEVADNVSSAFSSSDNPAEGGGIHIEDNAVGYLTRVRVLRNRANSGGGLSAYRARYEIVDSVVDSNQATGRTDGGIGGGINASSTNVGSVRPPSIVNVTGSLIRNNVGLTGGGIVVTGDVGLPATLTLAQSVVDRNQAQSQGGGILLSRANLSATGSLIIRNRVEGGAVAPFGGGILITTESSAGITGSTVAANYAGLFGGGIFMDQNAALQMNSSNLYDNSSGSRGGGLFVGATGSQTGTVQYSIIADNSSAQINEESCSGIIYRNNTITPKSGTTNFSGCTPSGSRLSNNNSNPPRFAHFLASPASGISASLAWSVARATSVTISGTTFTQSTGTMDVAPASSTTYTLTATATSANGGNYGAVTATVVIVLPPSGARSVEGDFDGDRRSDVSVFRPFTGGWYIVQSSTQGSVGYTWGGGTDIPVPGDYDGDRRTDVAIFRPSTGAWHIVRSSTGTGAAYTWGGAGDIPVARDYDGDGKTDIAVFRPSTGGWYISQSRTLTSATYIFGGGGDIPVPGDYDADGKADIGVFRPVTGAWHIWRSGSATNATYTWGGGTDVPVPADYDSDGRTDVAVFRPSTGTWYIVRSSTMTSIQRTWGGGGDIPVPGDYDGDGSADIAIFRPTTGVWYLVFSSNLTSGSYTWGGAGDIPLLKR